MSLRHYGHRSKHHVPLDIHKAAINKAFVIGYLEGAVRRDLAKLFADDYADPATIAETLSPEDKLFFSQVLERVLIYVGRLPDPDIDLDLEPEAPE